MTTRCLGCDAIIASGSRCLLCSRIRERARLARRATSGWDLQRRNRVTLALANGRCQLCGASATEIDHITPLAAGGADTESNRRALCRKCHAAKTRNEGRAG